MATEGAGVARYRMKVDGITGASIYDEMWTGHPHIKDINTVYVDTSNNQWYGLNKGALQHTSYNAKSDWNFLTEEEGLVNNNVLSITEDSTGSMWFGTAKGVSKFDGENWTSYTKSDGLPGDSIFDITTRFGAIWFATDKGVAKLGEENLPSGIHPGNNPYSNHFRIRIYPNPITANHSTINYYLPKAGKTMISVYDIRGKKVNNLVNGHRTQGAHTINWNVNGDNGQNLAPGIYILEVRNVQHRQTKNIVVVH
jgi:ligand-binding sensor domain-containing protein